jgi:caa(3)-type oxidase subunit IV
MNAPRQRAATRGTRWPAGFALASRHTDVLLGTLNTAVLLTSSAIVALAVACEEHPGARRWTANLLWTTAALGLAFMAIKGLEYHAEWREHLFPTADFALGRTAGAEGFWALYFVATGLHAVPLGIGLTWGLLLALMLTSLGSAYLRLGVFNMVTGLVIAAIKAALVLWLFMRLREAPALIRLVAAIGIALWGVLVVLSGVDYATRIETPAEVQRPLQLVPTPPASAPG